MTQPGIVSVTFRKRTPKQIIDLCTQAGVKAIEWGGDVHVPHGEIETAREVAALTSEAGLEVAAYGSYYRTVESEEAGLSFASVLETAEALGAPNIRVWPGEKSPQEASPAYRRAVADTLRDAAEAAASRGIGLSLEFHRKTLTETLDSARALLEAVKHPNLKTLWQPTIGWSFDQQLASLRGIRPWLNYFHVYTWMQNEKGETVRLPLAFGKDQWKAFLAEGQPPHALIEFVKYDLPEQFLADAPVLKEWLSA